MADITTGLAAWWKFDDGGGTTAADSSGNGNTGTLHGATGLPTWITNGRIGGALSFDGIDDYVTSSLSIASYPVTVAAWVKYDTNSTLNSFIIDTNGRAALFFIKNDVGNSDFVVFYNNIDQAASAADSIRAGVWNHICATVDASNNCSIYINGVLAVGPTTLTTPSFPATPVTIGASSGPGNFITAILDEVRIYTRALTAADVFALYYFHAEIVRANYRIGIFSKDGVLACGAFDVGIPIEFGLFDDDLVAQLTGSTVGATATGVTSVPAGLFSKDATLIGAFDA